MKEGLEKLYSDDSLGPYGTFVITSERAQLGALCVRDCRFAPAG